MKKFFFSLFILCFSGSFACEKCTEDMLEYLQAMRYFIHQTENENLKSYMEGTINGLNISLRMYKENHQTNYFPD